MQKCVQGSWGSSGRTSMAVAVHGLSIGPPDGAVKGVHKNDQNMGTRNEPYQRSLHAWLRGCVRRGCLLRPRGET